MAPAVPSAPTGTKYRLQSPSRGGAVLATRTWAPPKNVKPIALTLIVHGGGWHSGYFEELAQKLVTNNIFVAAYDQPGCGYSEPDPTAPKGCSHLISFDDIIDEVYEAIEWAQQEAGDDKRALPLFLLGESYGGVQVLSAAFEATYRGVPNLQGVVVLGGLLRIGKGLLPPPPVVKILSCLAPYYPRVKLPATDFESSFDDAFGDARWAAVARSDAKVSVSPQYTLGAAVASLTSGEEVLEKAADFPVKLLAIHGMRDCRTQCEAVQEFVDKVGPNKAELVLIDTSGHQLLQDTPEISNKVMDKVASWIRDTVSG